jgi:hypothetical protein
VKFFDVIWDAQSSDLIPVAMLRIDSASWPRHVSIVPVVFFTEEAMANARPGGIDDAAHKITQKIASLAALYHIELTELQFDCDWTGRSRGNYFALIEAVRKKLPGIILSATIRLHQVKFLSRTGIPPVDRGMLMFYNMSNWRDPATKNSILDLGKASAYTDFISRYPLPLDCALPIFRWVLMYRNDRFLAILRDIGEADLAASRAVESVGEHRYRVTRPAAAFGVRLQAGDLLRAEDVPERDVLRASQECLHEIRNSSVRLALYHWDSLTLSRYSYAALDSIYQP